MKSTYSLLTIYLDQQPLSDGIKNIELLDENYIFQLDAKNEISLFDSWLGEKRYLNGSELLSTNTEEELISLLKKTCVKEIYIILDYKNDGEYFMEKLFLRRILQAVKILAEKYQKKHCI